MADGFEAAASTASPAETVADVTPAEPSPEVAAGTQTPATDATDVTQGLQERLDAALKENHRLKSMAGGQRKADERQAELSDEITSVRRMLSALLNHQADGGDPKELKAQIETIQTEGEKQTAARSWETAYSKASGMLQEALYEGTVRVLDPKGPELRETALAWNEARAAEDREGLLEAVHLANLARRKYDRLAAAKEQEPKGPAPRKGPGIQMANVPGGPASSERTKFTRDDLMNLPPDQIEKVVAHLHSK